MSTNQKASAKALAYWDTQMLKAGIPVACKYSSSLRDVSCESVQELEQIADENGWGEIRDMASDEIGRRKSNEPRESEI